MFQSDYRYMLDVVANRRPSRMPIYEHIISPNIMEQILNISFAETIDGEMKDKVNFFSHYCRFFKEMTYDTVSFEICITDILPGNGALLGGHPGPIQTRADFLRYPWDELPLLFWQNAMCKFNALAQCLPQGLKALGGIGNGVFEISEALVGYEYLPYMQADDPDLFSDLYQKIGDLT